MTQPDLFVQSVQTLKKTTIPQADFVQRFAAYYKTVTGVPYKADRKDYVLAIKLLKQFGFDCVVNKARLLGAMCAEGSEWFAKGWGDFTIGNLSCRWNNIIPRDTTEDKKKRDEDRIRKEIADNAERTKRIINSGRRNSG